MSIEKNITGVTLIPETVVDSVRVDIVAGRVTSPNPLSEMAKPSPGEGDYLISAQARLHVRAWRHCHHMVGVFSDAFGMHPATDLEIEKICRRWMLIDDCTLEKALKCATASWHNLIMGQDLPVWPSKAVSLSSFLCGRIRMHIGQVIKNFQRKAESGRLSARAKAFRAAQTFLFMKKGAPSPPREMVKENAKKHRAALGDRVKGRKILPFSPRDQDGAASMDEQIITSIRSVIQECIPKGWARRVVESRQAAHFPSINGHFSSGRGAGGAATEILFNHRDCLLTATSRSSFPTSEQTGLGRVVANWLAPGELWQMLYHPHIGVREVRHDIRKSSTLMAIKLLQGLQHQRDYNCMTSFVLEPLKVRPVTAGPTVAYWLLKPFQGALWSSLKAQRAFHLIGNPVTSEFLNELFGVKDGVIPEQGERCFESGDYEAATDNLRAWLSRETWNFLAEWGEMPSWVRRIGSKSLVGHTIHYTDDMELEPVKQENGQLMGSILSFPILCIVNAAICRIGFEEPKAKDWADIHEGSLTIYQFSTKVNELPMTVNGDDCVMLYRADQRARWAKYATHAGLSLSIGKCYTAPDWLQINSAGFILRDSGFERAPYLNFALLGSRSARGDDIRNWTDLGSLAREFLDGFPVSKHKKLMSLFIQHHRRVGGLLNDVPEGVSWWLPEHLGGLGLPWTGDEQSLEEAISPRQRMLATHIHLSLQPSTSGTRNVPIKAHLGKEADFPLYIQEALVRDNHLMIPMPVEELPEEESDTDHFGKYKFKGSYSSSLWAGGLEIPVELSELSEKPFLVKNQSKEKSAENRRHASVRHWQRLWDSKAKLSGCSLPLASLLSSQRVSQVLPGGLSSVLERERGVPSRILRQISAILDCQKMGLHFDEMKACIMSERFEW